jgi:hypothetical protein
MLRASWNPDQDQRASRRSTAYERFDFDPGPVDPYQMFLLMKDVQRLVLRG